MRGPGGASVVLSRRALGFPAFVILDRDRLLVGKGVSERQRFHQYR
jgi:hypothetical protein